MRTPVVRGGEDAKHLHGEHVRAVVYSEMLRQIARDYSGLPDVRTMRGSEIRFFYEGLRPELKQATRPR